MAARNSHSAYYQYPHTSHPYTAGHKFHFPPAKTHSYTWYKPSYPCTPYMEIHISNIYEKHYSSNTGVGMMKRMYYCNGNNLRHSFDKGLERCSLCRMRGTQHSTSWRRLMKGICRRGRRTGSLCYCSCLNYLYLNRCWDSSGLRRHLRTFNLINTVQVAYKQDRPHNFDISNKYHDTDHKEQQVISHLEWY